MALKDLINSSKYGDDIVIALPDGSSATFGELRAIEAEERQKLTERANLLGQAEVEFATRFQKAVSTPSEPVEDQNRRAAAAAAYGLDENDPLLGQVAREMKRIEQESATKLAAMQKQHEEQVSKLSGIVAKVTGEYLNDNYAQQFSTVSANLPADIRKKVSLEDAVKYAEANRLMDKAGRYNIADAVDRLTWEERKEHEMKSVRAQAVIDAEKAAALARMQPKSALRTETKDSNFQATVEDNGRTRTKTFDEVLADAANDAELWTAAAMGGSN